MTTTTAASLAAKGARIAFSDGTEATVRYDFLSLLAIEEQYGSIQGLLDRVQHLDGADAASSPVIGTVLDLIRWGLEPDDHGTHPARHTIARKMDPRDLQTYIKAAVGALEEAFGPENPSPASGSRPDPTGDSTGSSGGPTPPSTDSSGSSGE